MDRRRFVQLSGILASTLFFAGCSSSPTPANVSKPPEPPKPPTPKPRGKGEPHFEAPMNQAKRIDSSPAEEEALAKFIVVSDTHVNYKYQPYADRVQNMFEDIAAFCPDNDAIIVNGDITDHGELWEYEKFAELSWANGFSYPDDFVLVIGNHDQYDSTEGALPVSNLSDRFKEQAGLADQMHPYYDRTINGVHLIMMGPDSFPDDSWAHFNVSEEQSKWMDSLVDADAQKGVISLVFMHEPMYDTVRDTKKGDFGHEWSLTPEENRVLRDHVRNHENMIFFSGHTHAYPDIVQLPKDAPLFVGTGSVAYCLDDPDADPMGCDEIDAYGSYGWEVTVWTNCIRFRLRNFLTHEFQEDPGTVIYQL